MSVFARNAPDPNCTILCIACPTDEYFTDEYSSGMPSLTDFPLGKDKWWMTRYWPWAFLGCRPRGENTISGMGGELYGPEIRPNLDCFRSFWSTISGSSDDDLRLGGGGCGCD